MLKEIGRYKNLVEIGSGGFGTVSHAYDPDLERDVAIKVIRQDLADDETYLDAFKREARLAGRLVGHPNITHVNDFQVNNNPPYIVMEYVPDSLDKHLRGRRPLPHQRAVEIAIQVCEALEYSHSKGVIHLDIKPSNILLTQDGIVKVTDFGIARATASSTQTKNSPGGGTPPYASWEQYERGQADKRSDIYALGITLYEMVTGKLPYQGDAYPDGPDQEREGRLPPFPSNLQIPRALEAVIRRATQRRLQDRFQDARAMASALERVVSGEPAVASPPAGRFAESAPPPSPPRRPATGVGSGSGGSRDVPSWILFGGGAALIAVLIVIIAVAIGASGGDGKETLQVITPGGDSEISGTISQLLPVPPDRIVFASGRNEETKREIYIMNADGSGQTRLTNNKHTDQWPVWSPDGRRIAFTSFRDGVSGIYIMNADGSDQTRLTTSPGRAWDPTWSPDGKRIAYYGFLGTNAEIFVATTDGLSQKIRLTKNSARDSQPTWSPDGARIAFASYRDGGSRIFAMNADGSNVTRLSYDGSGGEDPDWSPDGTRIAFSHGGPGNSQIWVMYIDGSGQTRLSNDLNSDEYPVWSSDGTRIVFTSYRDGNPEIYVMNSDGSGQTRLTTTFSERQPDWSPQQPNTMIGSAVSLTGEQEVQAQKSCIPSLVSPQNGATLGNGTVLEDGSPDVSDYRLWEFDWSDCERATQYHLVVVGPSASTPLIDERDLTSPVHLFDRTGYIAEANLLGWKWKVRAMVDGDWSDWSETQTFNVEPPTTNATRP
ncbi:MAG: serine/threonine-protein kinase [Chloroflexi bacterium]|nr:serine/threonine-protein kinase [Chloroflexota bacterium]